MLKCTSTVWPLQQIQKHYRVRIFRGNYTFLQSCSSPDIQCKYSTQNYPEPKKSWILTSWSSFLNVFFRAFWEQKQTSQFILKLIMLRKKYLDKWIYLLTWHTSKLSSFLLTERKNFKWNAIIIDSGKKNRNAVTQVPFSPFLRSLLCILSNDFVHGAAIGIVYQVSKQFWLTSAVLNIISTRYLKTWQIWPKRCFFLSI